MKKFLRKRFSILLVAGALALGLVGGGLLTAAAATGAIAANYGAAGDGDSSGRSFADRVAEKLTAALGLDDADAITEAQVQDAFNGATGDRQAEKLQAKLDELDVADATATAITDWFNDYPYSNLIRIRPIGLASSDKVSGALERLVEKERITQAQSDGIQAWYDRRPDLPDGLEHSGRHGHRGHGRGGDGDGSGHHRGGDGDGDGDGS